MTWQWRLFTNVHCLQPDYVCGASWRLLMWNHLNGTTYTVVDWYHVSLWLSHSHRSTTSQWWIVDYFAKFQRPVEAYIAKGNQVQSRSQNVHWLQHQHRPTLSVSAPRHRPTLPDLAHCHRLGLRSSAIPKQLPRPKQNDEGLNTRQLWESGGF